MDNIKEIWSNFDGTSEPEENIPLKILEAQAEAINKSKEKNEVYATVVTSSGTVLTEFRHVLYLLPVYGNGYNYRYIEFIQPIDDIYPISVSAFQAGNMNFGKVDRDLGEAGVYEVLTRVFKDPRTKIAFNHLKSMGRTIQSWKDSI